MKRVGEVHVRGFGRRAVGLVAAFFALLLVVILTGRSPGASAQDPIDVEPGLTLAVFGDSGYASPATAVLELVASEGADLVIHVGDFDYHDDPAGFEDWIDEVLGPDFPYFVAVGNHDVSEWPTYQSNFLARLGRVSGASCTGDYGVNSTCTYRGLSFVLSGVGTLGSGHEAYLEDALATNAHTWRLCAWHKNQTAMQVGRKDDDVGWVAYETCREHGAIALTGHEHSYSRTKTLVSMENQTVDPDWPESDSVRVGPGYTWAVVSGLGGRSVRDQRRCLPTTYPYGCKGEWASISSDSNGGDEGALFIEFGVDGDPNAARGRFVEVDGTVIDTFDITNQNWPGGGTTTTTHPTEPGRFLDDAGPYEEYIEAIAAAGITNGCDQSGLLFCPDEQVSRAQMASFVARWLQLPTSAQDAFDDDDGSPHEPSINAIAAAGITLGCNTASTTYCPQDSVSRAQMASLIARALVLDLDAVDRFTDDDGSVHEDAIDAIAAAGITLGCNEAGTLFCPDQPVLRKHMAAFIVRAGLNT